MDVAALTQWDTDKDGLITKTELVTSLTKSGLPYDKATMHANDFFSIADRANTGQVRLADFIVEYTRMSNFKMVYFIDKNMRMVDNDGDGQVSKAELFKVLERFLGKTAATLSLDQMFAEMDTDHSGSVSFEEVKRWYADTEQRIRQQQRDAFAKPPAKPKTRITGGYLTIKVLGAEGLVSEGFSNNDPYCIVQIGNRKFQTKTKSDGGRNPTWNQIFHIRLHGDPEEATVKFLIYDYDTFSADDLLGRADVSVAQLAKDGKQAEYPLLNGNFEAGRFGQLNLDVTFEPTEEVIEDKEAACSETENSATVQPTDIEEPEELKEEFDEYDADIMGEYGRPVNPEDIDNADEIANDPSFGITLNEQDPNQPKTRFLSIKPWRGAIFEPTHASRVDGSAPDSRLELEWAYGYRAFDSRNNIAINTEGHVIYPTAGLVIKYDAKNHAQQFFQGHNDDVITLAQNPANPDIVATGQIATIVNRRATLPHICVWNSRSGAHWRLSEAHKSAVRAIGFSKSGKYLASIGNDTEQMLYVWDWQNTNRLASHKTEYLPNKMFALAWNNDSEFVVVGMKAVYFFEFAYGRLERKRGSMGSGYYRQSYYCCTWTKGGYAVVGCRDGHIYIFKAGKAIKNLQSHASSGSVYALTATANGGFISGGRDGDVVVHSADFKELYRVSLNSAVRSISVDGTRMVIGLISAEIVEIANYANEQERTRPRLLVKGHDDGETWGLDVDPNNPNFFATCGDDNKIIVWEAKSHRFLTVQNISEKEGRRLNSSRASSTSKCPDWQCARAIAFSPDSQFITVGTNEGELSVVELKTMKQVVLHNLNETSSQNVIGKRDNWIQTLKFSPNGRTLAVGTHGSVIVLCDVKDNFRPVKVLDAHNAAVTHLDWSRDSKFLQSNCRAYELLFHEIDHDNLKNSKMQPSASKLRDVEWATQTCIFGYGVQSVFDPLADGTDVNNVDRSPDGTLLASGDDFGYVNLYRYPCAADKPQRQQLTGHSSHVMCVRWLWDGSYLLSVGGNDKSILQFRRVDA